MTSSGAVPRGERLSALRSPWTVLAAFAVFPVAVAAAETLPEDAARQQLQSVVDELKSGQSRIEAGRDREQALQEKERAASKALDLSRLRLRAATTGKRRIEQELMMLEDELVALDIDHATKRTALMTLLHEESAMLGLMLRVTRFPPEAMIALPASPVNTVRAVIVSRRSLDWLSDQARPLKSGLMDLEAVRIETAEKRELLREKETILAAKTDELRRQQRDARAEVDRWTQQRRLQTEQNRVQDQRIRELAAAAKDLGDLIERLERERREREAEAQRAAEAALRAEETQQQAALTPPRPPTTDVSPAPDATPSPLPRPPGIQNFDGGAASLFPPAPGKIVRQYGAKDDFGAASKGLMIETRAGAEVVAPFDGQVVFAGPFRGYGQILLIDHGGGYHTLLAGVGRIDIVLGQWLLAGEPVAVMSETESGRPRLYVEFRRNGQPINPLPWLAAGESKVNG
jgi:septal ring factor EnvC (AmiA/AmiB activator)